MNTTKPFISALIPMLSEWQKAAPARDALIGTPYWSNDVVIRMSEGGKCVEHRVCADKIATTTAIAIVEAMINELAEKKE